MRSARSLSLDQFIALNEEMAALTRAGVPLHRGLLDLGRDLPGGLGAMASKIGRRLEQGEPLEAIIADESHRFPPLYRAVMLAGIRSGNLAAALEGLAATARRAAEMRRMVAVAMLYPVFVLLTAIVLFALLATRNGDRSSRRRMWIGTSPAAGWCRRWRGSESKRRHGRRGW
jgi:type II secretory pathway component PulF